MLKDDGTRAQRVARALGVHFESRVFLQEGEEVRQESGRMYAMGRRKSGSPTGGATWWGKGDSKRRT